MFLRFISIFIIFTIAGCGGGGGGTSLLEMPAPPSNNPPVFTSSSSFDVEENQTIIGILAATDADGDTVSYSIPEDDKSTVSIDSSTGALSFFEPPDYESVQSYSITAIASDGTDETTQSLSVAIVNIAAPSLSEMAVSGTHDDGQSEDLSPRIKTMTLMRFPINCRYWRFQNEEAIQRRTNHQSYQAA